MVVRFLLLSLLPSLVASDSSTCERLKATLTYTQEDAPRDLSSVVSLVSIFFGGCLNAVFYAMNS